MCFISRLSGREIKRGQQPRESSCMVLMSRGEQFQPLSRQCGKAACQLRSQSAHFAIDRQQQELQASAPLREHALRLSEEPWNVTQHWVAGVAADTNPSGAL